MSERVYEVERVSKTYKKKTTKANDEISFEVLQGEILGVLGPNGAGKSTLIRQMVGQTAPSEGEIRFYGRNVLKHTKEVAANVAYYSQEPYALNSLKVKEALMFTGRLRGMAFHTAARQCDELLERFEMEEFRDKTLKTLSGGQKRMIGIGTALIGKAPVMILDEPTNELDPKKRRLVWNLIQEWNQHGTTVILVTHNILEAEQVVDRVAVINHGRLLAIDSIGKLKQKVDQRLKFEITSGLGRRDEVAAALSGFGTIQPQAENRLQLMVEKAEASRVLDYIVCNGRLPIEEYAIVPPSLEDVYFHIDGQEPEKEAALKEAALG